MFKTIYTLTDGTQLWFDGSDYVLVKNPMDKVVGNRILKEKHIWVSAKKAQSLLAKGVLKTFSIGGAV